MKIISIDPSFSNTGIAILDNEDIEFMSIITEQNKIKCPICGAMVKDPTSKSHLSTVTHKNALDSRRVELPFGDIMPSKSISKTRKIKYIRDEIQKILNKYDFDYAIIEGLSYSSSGNSLADLSGLQHAIRILFLENGIKFIVIPPTVAKIFWVGKGNASKNDMISKTKSLGIEIPFNYDDNCNDAFVFLMFMINLLKKKLPFDLIRKIEYSWDITKGL